MSPYRSLPTVAIMSANEAKGRIANNYTKVLTYVKKEIEKATLNNDSYCNLSIRDKLHRSKLKHLLTSAEYGYKVEISGCILVVNWEN